VRGRGEARPDSDQQVDGDVAQASKPLVLPPSAMNANALLWVGNPGMEGQVDLAPGERAVVEFSVPVADLTIVDAKGRRVVEPGEFELRVGPSSRAETLSSARFLVDA
jgi:hypothetical protein